MEVYIDDMLVKYFDAKDHINHLQQAFDLLRNYNMKLNLDKCFFGVQSGKFMSYLISKREGSKLILCKLKQLWKLLFHLM